MSKCEHCKKEVDTEWDTGFIWIGDGDIICSQECLEKYEKAKQHFYEIVLPNNTLFEAWMQGEEV